MARALGISFEITTNLPVDDGINAGRLMFGPLWIDETNCSFSLDANRTIPQGVGRQEGDVQIKAVARLDQPCSGRSSVRGRRGR